MILETNIARTFAALSATNEAILYAKSPEELYRRVCEAAFSSGDFLATAVFLLEPGTDELAVCRRRWATTSSGCASIDISIAADTPEGSGVCGQAFRDQKISISNDFLNDARSLAWRKGVRKAHVGSAAALPLICNGRSVGVLLVTLHEAGSLKRPSNLAAQAHVGEYFICARQFRSRGRAQAAASGRVRRVNRMFGAHQRDQRGHSAREDAAGSLSSGCAMPPSMAENPWRRWCCSQSRVRPG